MRKIWIAVAAVAAVVIAGGVVRGFASGGHHGSVQTLIKAVNFFQNGEFTGGAPLTVDAQGPVEISDGVELPSYAFNVYSVDATGNSLTMTLIAELDKLAVTMYDDTTIDQYWYAFDTPIKSAEISDATDDNFAATVELFDAGLSVSSVGAFVDGLPTDFTFENGGILITIGEGTNLEAISANGGSLTVDFE